MTDTTTWEVGRATEEELPDLTPIEFTLYAYEREPDAKGVHKEHKFVFRARATEPTGTMLEMYGLMDARGVIPKGPSLAAGARFIRNCILTEDRPRWDEVLDDPDLHIQAAAVAQLSERLIAFYSGKDGSALPRSARRSIARHTGRTTTGGRSAKASGSRKSAPTRA